MTDHETKPSGTGISVTPPIPMPRKFVLTDEEIQGTFEILGLSDEARRAEFTNLRGLASGFHIEQRTWTLADSVTDLGQNREA